MGRADSFIPPAAGEPADPWHRLPTDEVCRRLGCDPERGLDSREVERRLARFGPNAPPAGRRRGPWRILGEQLRGSLIYLLVGAAALSFFLGETRDALAISAIVVLNAVLGFVQDFRAERAMAALERLSEPRATVLRDGREQRVDARGIVPGDLLLPAAGDRPAADARLLESFDLVAEEAALTGESEGVTKDAAALDEADLPLGDRACMVYQGTRITQGRARAVVVATGSRTELGQIAGLLRSVRRRPTPLQRRLSRLGHDLSLAAAAMVLAVVALGLVTGEDPRLMVMLGLALAVAAVPEGLPAVSTLALALGARRMLAENALIRKLPAVETLGSVTVICSDKTGTLTRNRMTVAALEPADNSTGRPLAPDGTAADLGERPAAAWLVAAGVLCNDVTLPEPGREEDPPAGDSMEQALAAAGRPFGLARAELEKILPRFAEVPFDPERRRMTTVHRKAPSFAGLPGSPGSTLPDGTAAVALTKGAPESVLSACTRVMTDAGPVVLDAERLADIRRGEQALADGGMRVLACACRFFPTPPDADAGAEELEQELVFLGLVGIHDPLRPGARESVERCRRAGIRPVMITGDHPRTALAIARAAGIAVTGKVTEGRALADLAPEELDRRVEDIEVYARVSPRDKLRIVEALERRGHVVAMTGDGVNDAPALQRASIGVAMGAGGTDVAREAADMVLLDDDFSTIVSAVRQGRRVYDNIRRFLLYTLASNTGEIVTMIAAPLLGMPLALLPLQILWINLVTDGLPGLALGAERAEPGTMSRPPTSPKARLLDRRLVRALVWIGLLMGAVSLGAGLLAHLGGADEARRRTVIFTVLTLSQMGNALALRSFHRGFFDRAAGSSPALLAAVGLTLVLQLAVVYVPFLQEVFSTVPLTAGELGLCAAASTLVFVAVEVRKSFARRRPDPWM